MPGSAHSFPGEYTSPAAGFATGMPLDTAPGGAVLGLFAMDAAGDDDRYPGATDDELVGVICALDRVEAHVSARKHAAVAELIRRRPARGCAPEGPAQMPAEWDEFTAAELAPALGESRGAAGALLWLTHDLEVKLPGTRAAFRAGIVNQEKAQICCSAPTPGPLTAARTPGPLTAAPTPGALMAEAVRRMIRVPETADQDRPVLPGRGRRPRPARWLASSRPGLPAGSP